MIVVAGEGVVARFDLRREERERIDTKLKADVAEAAEKLRLASMSSPRKHGALKSPLKSPRKLPSQSPRPTSSRADERNSGSIKLTKPNFVSKSPKTSTVSGKFAEQPSSTASTKQMRHASTLPVKKQQQTSPQQQLSKSPRTPTRSSISSGNHYKLPLQSYINKSKIEGGNFTFLSGNSQTGYNLVAKFQLN